MLDNASGASTAEVARRWPGVLHLREPINRGGAAGYALGIKAALAMEADLVWLMDDDGRPADPCCLGTLLRRAAEGAGIAAPMVMDNRRPDLLAFPIRLRGRTRMNAADVTGHGPVDGFAHLFNGALISRSVFETIGLPDPRFFIRGDEVEFLCRARRAGLRITLDPAAAFLHPGSHDEIHPILFGEFYAVVPACHSKRFYLFRNRAFIFRRYGMWAFLAMDVVRYAHFFLVNERGDLSGFAQWLRVTALGLRGRFMQGNEGV